MKAMKEKCGSDNLDLVSRIEICEDYSISGVLIIKSGKILSKK